MRAPFRDPPRPVALASAHARVLALHERLACARARLVAADAGVVRAQVALSEIPAPIGGERARGEAVADRLRALGLLDVATDDAGNVTGARSGKTDEAPIVVCAHLDTVFPVGTRVGVTRDGMRLTGPGIVDNARGLAAMLALAEILDGESLRTVRPIVFAATVGEEGAGDLRGAKHLFSRLAEMPAACLVIDGAGDDRIVHRALGARRLRVTFTGAGGHSWAAFGVPNPVHAAGAAAAKLAALPLPRSPRTTLSVCRIGGGISVNAIPEDAWIEIDLRSSSREVIERCAADIELAVRAAVREENLRRSPGTAPLTFDMALIGDRPCGELSAEHALVATARAATHAIGRVPELVAASTDANVPISLGIPAVTIGSGGTGGAFSPSGIAVTSERPVRRASRRAIPA